MITISDEYRALNRQLHEKSDSYGSGGQTKQWYPFIDAMARATGATSILDYGCGKGELRKSLTQHMILPYDPSIPEFSAPPEAHDMVVCLDVLEHIEPELLENVLNHIQLLAKKCVFLTVHTGPAFKFLADGRNAHLIQEDINWWLPQFTKRWDIISVQKRDQVEFTFAGMELEMTALAKLNEEEHYQKELTRRRAKVAA